MTWKMLCLVRFEALPTNLKMKEPKPDCACVSHDARECARIRDRREIDPDYLPNGTWPHRACECECHAEERDDNWEDGW